jgi:hypothetical protein
MIDRYLDGPSPPSSSSPLRLHHRRDSVACGPNYLIQKYIRFIFFSIFSNESFLFLFDKSDQNLNNT